MENKRTNKKKKNKNKMNIKAFKANKKTLIMSAVILFIVAFCVYKVVMFIKNPTDTFTVEQGKIYQTEKAIGYIIREETIVKGSNYKNGIEQIKTEGERVAKGEAIFRYYSSGEENLINKIKDLDVKIDEAISKENNLLSGDIRTLEKQIESQVISLRNETSIQTITKVKKAKIAGKLSPAGSYLNKLINERSNYENKLNEGSERLNAPISGTVSYKVDGYEDVLTPKDFSKITSKLLNDLNLKTGQIVADSKESAKIINNFECYIACVLDSKQAQEAEVGKKIKLKLSNNKEVTSEIECISKENEKIVIIFKIDEQVQEMISYRKVSFDIIWWSDSGKKIPNTALGKEQKGENEVSYIIRTRNGYQDKILVKVLRQNDKYTIVDNYTSSELKELGYTSEEIKGRKTLTLYDEILKNPT